MQFIVYGYNSQGLMIECHDTDSQAEAFYTFSRFSCDPRIVRVVIDIALPPDRTNRVNANGWTEIE